MSLRPSSSRRNAKSTGITRIVPGAHNYFVALIFAESKEDYIDKTEITTHSATVILNGLDVILDYSHLDPIKNKEDIEEIVFFFNSVVSSGDTITLDNAKFLNALTGDEMTYDLAGTITFNKFDKNNLTIHATKVSLNKESSNYSVYDYRYFLSPLSWTTSSSVDSSKVEKVNQIINMVPVNSNNSFINSFGELFKGDILEISIDGILYTFTIINYEEDDTNGGSEVITVNEPIPSVLVTSNYVGTSVYALIKRKSNSKRKMADSTNETSPLNTTTISPYIEPKATKKQTSTYKAKQNTKGIVAASAKKETTKTSLESAKEMHMSSGSPTIYVKVVKSNTNKNIYSFKHSGAPKWEDQGTLNLEAGKTYKFVQSDKSNGPAGHTKDKHSLMISSCPETMCDNSLLDYRTERSNSNPGINNSYFYFGPVPDSFTTLYTHCHYHEGMGGKIQIGSVGVSSYEIPDSIRKYTNKEDLERWFRNGGVTERSDLDTGSGLCGGNCKCRYTTLDEYVAWWGNDWDWEFPLVGNWRNNPCYTCPGESPWPEINENMLGQGYCVPWAGPLEDQPVDPINRCNCIEVKNLVGGSIPCDRCSDILENEGALLPWNVQSPTEISQCKCAKIFKTLLASHVSEEDVECCNLQNKHAIKYRENDSCPCSSSPDWDCILQNEGCVCDQLECSNECFKSSDKKSCMEHMFRNCVDAENELLWSTDFLEMCDKHNEKYNGCLEKCATTFGSCLNSDCNYSPTKPGFPSPQRAAAGLPGPILGTENFNPVETQNQIPPDQPPRATY